MGDKFSREFIYKYLSQHHALAIYFKIGSPSYQIHPNGIVVTDIIEDKECITKNYRYPKDTYGRMAVEGYEVLSKAKNIEGMAFDTADIDYIETCAS